MTKSDKGDSDSDVSMEDIEMSGKAEDNSDAESESESQYNFLQRLTKRPCILICIFCGIIVYGILGILFDWLWVNDMLTVEKGLVFGPSGTGIIVTLIVIASLGTVSFFFEIADFTKKVYTGEPLFDEDIEQMITLFVDELPSITLSFLLARCREVPVSYYQMAKAALTMVGAGFRFFRTLYHYFNPSEHRWTGFIPWLLRSIIVAACVYNVVAAVLVFVYTYTVPPEDGSGFKPPSSILDKTYDNGRYFYKSGVYFSHPVFADCNHGYLENWNETRINWIKLDGIYTILDDEEPRWATFYYNDDETFLVSQNLEGNEECYHTDLRDPFNCVTQLDTVCDTDNDLYDRIVFTFRSAEQDKALVFGDIKFNASLTYRASTVCQYLTIDEWGFLLRDSSDIIAQLQYLQADMELNDTLLVDPFFAESGGELRHYRYYDDEGEMNNVTDVWLTGYKKCDMTGALAPNPDEDLQPICGDNSKKRDTEITFES